MKNLSLLNVLMMAFAIFALSSCGSDDTTITLSPTISFVDEVGFLSSDADVAPGADFSVRVRAASGDNPMNSLTIKQDDVNVDFSRITIVGISTVNNPQVVTDTEADAFTWDITITAHTDAIDAAYDFIVADNAGNTGTATIYINAVGGTLGVDLSSGANNCLVTNIISTDQTTFCLNVNAERGAAALEQIAVWEDNALVDASRLSLADNPTVLVDAERNGLTDYEISIQSHADAGAKEYIVEITDADGAVVTTSIFVTIGTTVDELTGVLLNQGGPAGQGGLDLDTGVGTGTQASDTDSEIKDEGINGNPLPTNWNQKISGMNGSVIKFANNLPDGSGYASITTQEEIAAAFASADDLSGGVSDVVNVDDEFVVERDGKYYFLLVTAVNVTTDDNADSYTFSIKK